MIVDAHVHISKTGKWFDTTYDASLSRLLRDMDAASVDRAVILPLVDVLGNGEVSAFCRQYPDRLIGFGTIDIRERARLISEQFEQVQELGLRGIKFHPRFQELSPDNEALYPLYEMASNARLPIVFCGWPQCRSRRVTLDSITPYVYDEVAKRFPELRMVIAHMGGHRALDAYFVARSNKNVYLDTSYVFSALKGTSVHQDLLFILSHLQEKVIFGSDFPEIDIAHYVGLVAEEITGLGLSTPDRILGRNFLSLLEQG